MRPRADVLIWILGADRQALLSDPNAPEIRVCAQDDAATSVNKLRECGDCIMTHEASCPKDAKAGIAITQSLCGLPVLDHDG
jgi:hypothetical protein